MADDAVWEKLRVERTTGKVNARRKILGRTMPQKSRGWRVWRARSLIPMRGALLGIEGRHASGLKPPDFEPFASNCRWFVSGQEGEKWRLGAHPGVCKVQFRGVGSCVVPAADSPFDLLGERKGFID